MKMWLGLAGSIAIAPMERPVAPGQVSEAGFEAQGAVNAVLPVTSDQLKPPLARVKRQVINGGVIMPAFKGKLTDAQITAVAKYVAAHSGKK